MKIEKVTTATEFCILQLVLQIPTQTDNSVFFFWTKLTQKGYFRFKTEKVNTTEFWIFKFAKIYTKFQFEPTVLIFWTKFAQKGYFQSKLEKLNTTIEFCKFKSVYIPNFSLS